MKFSVGDRCNATLGGVCSIQLSYCDLLILKDVRDIGYILLNFYVTVKKIREQIERGKEKMRISPFTELVLSDIIR